MSSFCEAVSQAGGCQDHSHEHSHEHEHDHGHAHEHDSEDEEVPPVDRIICPGDVVDLEPSMETIYIVGTRGEKVTKISGLEGMVELKVIFML
jgi:hypothetical protein